MRRVVAASLLVVGLSAPAACGSSDGPSGQGGASAATTGSSASTASGGGDGCASNVLCGESLCCPEGDECVGGACAPACASGVRCASACCAAGQVCSASACASPTTPCGDSVDCAPTEYCEPLVGKCLPNPPAGCTLPRPKATFTPALLWSFTTPTVSPSFDQTVSAPLIVDADHDGTPDVFVTTGDIDLDNGVNAGYLRMLDGKTGVEKWGAGVDAYLDDNRVNVTFSPALADLDGDGDVEIVAMGAPSWQLIAFEPDGSVKWKSHDANGDPYVFPSFYASTIAVADLDGDGQGEVVIGATIFDSTGMLVSGDGKYLEGDGSGYSSSSIIADVDGDGKQEVVVGNAAYRRDGSTVWTQPIADGYPAIADLDLDGKPELVVTTPTTVRVQDATTGAVLHELTIATVAAGWPGSPAIADFDGDGKPDIAIQFVDGQNTPCTVRVFGYDPVNGLVQRWATPLDACSGFLTPTAFDFDGDGHVEILAHDDCHVTVLKGDDGSVELKLPASHATWTEFTSMADVDGDGSADLLFSTNDEYAGADQSASYDAVCNFAPGETTSNGLFVFHDPMHAWMPTRSIWNQQAYHITNIRFDGSLPTSEVKSWGPEGFNDYRVNAERITNNAPDLVVSLGADSSGCPSSIALVAIVENQGSLGVPAGVDVSFFSGTAPNGSFLGTAKTTKVLLAGASETIDFPVTGGTSTSSAYYAVVDWDQAMTGSVDECDETNNTGTLTAGCPQPK